MIKDIIVKYFKPATSGRECLQYYTFKFYEKPYSYKLTKS